MKSLLMYINKEKQANGRKSPSGNDESKLSFRFLRSKKVVRGLTLTTQDRLRFKESPKAFFSQCKFIKININKFGG